ncbi:unnamed protein product [Ranitomeya imitator]|uniref:Uncharacterized protein n=1 Tax=Ranitomeya imitator TaxID=111125 RepID=A0ABN9M9V7_9NEOB|nr:unnamed protein product [Ranitomeya imitator]
MKCLYEREVDCIGTMYPAFALMSGGASRLNEVITEKYLDYSQEIGFVFNFEILIKSESCFSDHS